METSALYEHVIRQANVVAYQADRYDEHPTYNTVAAIRAFAERVGGMYSMAMDFNDMQGNEAAQAAVMNMTACVAALVERRALARKIGKGQPRGYARARR